MGSLYLAIFAPPEGMSDEWSLFLASPNEFIHTRVTGSYLNYERTITTDKPDEDVRFKDSKFLGTIDEGNIRKYREIMYKMEVNNSGTQYNSHLFVKNGIEKIDRAGILNTGSKSFQRALTWMQAHFEI